MFKKADKIDIVDFQKEQRKRKRKFARKQAVNSAMDWIRTNKDVLMLTGAVAVPVITGVTKVTSKALANHAVNKEIRFKERTIYDHSLGRYVELKRKLTPAQALSIEERRANGEKLHMILDDMGLLKK